MSEKFDVIVVGAGPAGTACAYTCAKNGLKVLQIERGEYPGSKNVMGGVLYRKQMEELIPQFWHEAPLERPIIEQRFWMMDKESVVTFGYKGLEWGVEPYNNFTVLRAQFDQWFAQKAVEEGVLLINETVVTECLVENGKVIARIDASSIFTNNDDRDNHLRSADFFDVEKFPGIIFESTKFEKVSDEEYKLRGNLTIKDVTKEITLNVEYGGSNKDPWGNTKAGFSLTGKINRKDWGLNWNAALEAGGVLVGDDISISGEVQFAKQA